MLGIYPRLQRTACCLHPLSTAPAFIVQAGARRLAVPPLLQAVAEAGTRSTCTVAKPSPLL